VRGWRRPAGAAVMSVARNSHHSFPLCIFRQSTFPLSPLSQRCCLPSVESTPAGRCPGGGSRVCGAPEGLCMYQGCLSRRPMTPHPRAAGGGYSPTRQPAPAPPHPQLPHRIPELTKDQQNGFFGRRMLGPRGSRRKGRPACIPLTSLVPPRPAPTTLLGAPILASPLAAATTVELTVPAARGNAEPPTNGVTSHPLDQPNYEKCFRFF